MLLLALGRGLVCGCPVRQGALIDGPAREVLGQENFARQYPRDHRRYR